MRPTIGDLVQRYEKVYGCLLESKTQFRKAYNAFKDKYGYDDWGNFDFTQYEYYTKIMRDQVEYDSFVQDRELYAKMRKYVHEECQGHKALKAIKYA
jgi:hypothetical protein